MCTQALPYQAWLQKLLFWESSPVRLPARSKAWRLGYRPRSSKEAVFLLFHPFLEEQGQVPRLA